jgi:PAS domain S-box-containing protein
MNGEREPAARGDSFSESASGWMHAIAPFGIFTTDRELKIRSWNQWLVTHSGLTESEMIGRPLTEAFPDLESRRLLSRFTRALAGEVSMLSTALHEYLLPFSATVAGTRQEFMLQTARIAPLPGAGGIEGTITIIEDVSQREHHALTLQRQQELDRLLSVALGALLQSADPAEDIGKIFTPIMPSFGLDAYFCYLWHTESGCFRLHAAAGISPKQREGLFSLSVQEGDRIDGRNQPLKIEQTLAAHARSLASHGLQSQRSWPLNVGERIIGFVSFGGYQGAPVSEDDGNLLSRIVHFLAIALDRTAKEREAVAASRAKDDFMAALSHELRTPLNPVLLIASDSASNPEFSDEARDAFRSIEKNAQLEARLIDDLLDLTRIEHNKLSLELKPVDAHSGLMDALANVRADADDKKIDIQVNLDAPASLLLGDPARLQQIFWNLLKNGIKFTPVRGKLWIKSAVDAAAGEWMVEITDTGIGMEPHELGRIFNAFSQGDHASGHRHRFGGLGLGLAITQKLVGLHLGRIEASSGGKDQGSTFRVYFPMMKTAVVSVLPDRADPAEEPVALGQLTGRQARVLLVEDHSPTRVPLVALLKRRGFDVVAVGSATEALDAAAHSAFDLVLSDIGLPGMDGFTLMRLLKDKHKLPAIALTGYGMESDIALSTDAGFLAHLTKPINMVHLDRTLKTVMESLAR